MTRSPNENQESVSAWCDEHYPGFDKEARLLDLIEETVELAAAMGISKEAVFARAEKSWEKSQKDFGDRTQIPKEIGDVQIATLWLAQELGVDAQKTLDKVMQGNRARRPDESRARLEAKEKIFKAPPGTKL